MKSSLRAATLGIILGSASGHQGPEAQHFYDEIEWTTLSKVLPKPTSDMTATYVRGKNGDEDGRIIVMGGCDHPKGNQRDPDLAMDLFFCESVTDSTYLFNPFTQDFTVGATAPNRRYRHAAVAFDKHVYVFGGRDAQDDLVSSIDRYDIFSNSWETVGTLANVTSDLSAWVWNDYIYVAGGFVADYTAVGTVVRYDMAVDPGFASPESMSEMVVPRGDFHAVTLHGYAYLVGGITHANNWCTSLADVERYHMASDEWEVLQPLDVGRADMAVSVLNGKLIAAGGEVKPKDCLTLADPAYGSLPQDDVEVYVPSQGTNEWMTFPDFPSERFRFAAATVPARSALFTFGGQVAFDEDCQCFATSDVVGKATESFRLIGDDGHSHSMGSSSSSSSSTSSTASSSTSSVGQGAAVGIGIGCLVAGLIVGGCFGAKWRSGGEEAITVQVNAAETEVS